MKLILIRHGETFENKAGIAQGHYDGKLNQNGKAQAKLVAKRLKEYHIDAIYTSDLSRASDTAKEIAKYHDGPLVLTKALREFDIGSYTGKPKSEVDWNNPPDDAETKPQATIRMRKFLDNVYKKHADDTVVWVSHGGISDAFIKMLEESDERIKFGNTAVSIIKFDVDKNHHITLLNCTDHLSPTREECLQWYHYLDTPQNIIDHVITVNKIAVDLAKRLHDKGIKIDLEAVDRASLLHDLDKWLCINKKNELRHGEETEKILTEKGYPYLGFLAKQHRADLIVHGLETWEEKLISYSDRRVVHEKIVSIKERMDYIKKKYPPLPGEDRELITRLYFELEKEIFSKLDIRPLDLLDLNS